MRPEEEDQEAVLAIADGLAGGAAHQDEQGDGARHERAEAVEAGGDPGAGEGEEDVEQCPDEGGGSQGEEAQGDEEEVEDGQVVGDLREMDEVVGVAAQGLSPGVDAGEEHTDAAPLEILALGVGVAEALAEGESGGNGQKR